MTRALLVLLLCGALSAWSACAQFGSLSDQAFLGRTIAAAVATNYPNAFFNGTNQFMFKANDYSDNSLGDSTTFTFSGWVNRQTNGVDTMIFQFNNNAGADRLQLYIDSLDRLHIGGFQFSGAQVFSMVGTNTIRPTNGWTHLYACVDLSSSAKTKFYINGVLDATNAQTRVNTAIDFAGTSYQYYVGRYSSAVNHWKGAFSDLWLDDTYLDDPTKFYSAGHPVALGANGELPTGTQPVFLFNGATNTFNTFVGSGAVDGAFGITNGPLTAIIFQPF